MKAGNGTYGWWGLSLGLGLAVLLTAVSVIDTSHRCRVMYARLQDLQLAQWNMQEQWGRLLLEQSTWASHHRVEQLARKQLKMRLPTTAELQVVLP
jgi:cell division protein FtsL